MISRARSTVRRFWARFPIREFWDQCVVPFAVGFISTALLIACYNYLQNQPATREELLQRLPPHIIDKQGQLHLQRHGIQYTAMDVTSKGDNEMLKMSIRAPASNNFERQLVEHKPINNTSSPDSVPELEEPIWPIYNEPPGTIWPWPRIESEGKEEPLVWVVTPTFRSPVQYAELTRTAQALYPARKFVRWIVVDDVTRSHNYPDHLEKLGKFLEMFSLNFTLLESKRKPRRQRIMFDPKGVAARRTALEYVRQNKLRGIIYFADDDNTYDSDIFRQMQETKEVSIWPTGAITQWTISSPVVNTAGKVVDFFDAFVGERDYPVDFASFAINLDLFHKKPKANIPWVGGYEETGLLSSLDIKMSAFMPLSANATELLTWHTKTVRPKIKPDPSTLENINDWPSSVKVLIDKYDFLFKYDEKPKTFQMKSFSKGLQVADDQAEVPKRKRKLD